MLFHAASRVHGLQIDQVGRHCSVILQCQVASWERLTNNILQTKPYPSLWQRISNALFPHALICFYYANF